MTIESFWELIEASLKHIKYQDGRDSTLAQTTFLVDSLSEFAEQDILDFESIFRDLAIEADNYNVMALLFLIEGSVTDDGYLYFRLWVILKGQNFYQKALTHTDSLADIVERDMYINGESFMSVADSAYIKKKGQKYDETNLPSSIYSEKQYDHSDTKGIEWDYEDLPNLFPQLFKKSGIVL